MREGESLPFEDNKEIDVEPTDVLDTLGLPPGGIFDLEKVILESLPDEDVIKIMEIRRRRAEAGIRWDNPHNN